MWTHLGYSGEDQIGPGMNLKSPLDFPEYIACYTEGGRLVLLEGQEEKLKLFPEWIN